MGSDQRLLILRDRPTDAQSAPLLTPFERSRRRLLTASALALAGCDTNKEITGGFVGLNEKLGHLLRDQKTWPTPATTHRTQVLIAGGGVAGLSAARALRLQGIEDFALLELESEAGGNARGGQIAGIPHPLGAHYLPTPSDAAPEVQDFLEELAVRQRIAGRWQYDERHLCHSPQERLFFQGEWQEGLLPVHNISASTQAQYRKFAQIIAQQQRGGAFQVPRPNRPLAGELLAQAAITFVAFLDQQGLNDPHLRWYLDYCCRDDYGAGIDVVSAWAGIHYFASRHGFAAPGESDAEKDGVLTWPEGNAFLTRALARPCGDRIRTGRVVLRIAEVKGGVEVDAYNAAAQSVERWTAARCIVALPVFVAARVVQSPPDFLMDAAARTRYASWLVANIHINAPLFDSPGAAPAWDNVIYGSAGLGYVDAMHQSLRPVPGATVLTYYKALGIEASARRALVDGPWSDWRDKILGELNGPHPDLPRKVQQIDLMRYGHAMAVPIPGFMNEKGHSPANYLRKQLSKREHYPTRPTPQTERLSFAHSDWSGYSVFEEAFVRGWHAA
jgi:NAD(P)-binding Rossmann-like domain